MAFPACPAGPNMPCQGRSEEEGGINGGARGANSSSLHAITKVGPVGSSKAHDTLSASSREDGRTCDLQRCLLVQCLPAPPPPPLHTLTWVIDLSQCFLDHSKAVAPPLVRNGIPPQWTVPPLCFDRTPAVQQSQWGKSQMWEHDPVS